MRPFQRQLCTFRFRLLDALGPPEDSPDGILAILGDPVVGFGLIGGVYSGYLLLPCLIVLAVAADQTTGMNMVKMVLVPDRWKHVVGEGSVLMAIVCCGTFVGGGLGLMIARITLQAYDAAFSFSQLVGLLAVVRLTLGCAALGMMMVGVAFLVRRPGAALGVGVFLLLLAPFLLQLMPGLDRWSAALPSTALERFTLPDYSPTSAEWWDPGRFGAFLILVAWMVVPLVAGGWRYCTTDCQQPNP